MPPHTDLKRSCHVVREGGHVTGGAARDHHHALEPPPHRVQVGVLFPRIVHIDDEDILMKTIGLSLQIKVIQ